MVRVKNFPVVRIVGIAVLDQWHFDLIEREHIEIFLRNMQRRVWTDKSDAEEKRFAVFLFGKSLDLIHCPVGVTLVGRWVAGLHRLELAPFAIDPARLRIAVVRIGYVFECTPRSVH